MYTNVKKPCTERIFYKKTKEETWIFERVTDEHTVKKLQVWNYKIVLNK